MGSDKIKVYTDHTGRWYEEYTKEEYDALMNDPLFEIMGEEVKLEIDKEIMEYFYDELNLEKIFLIEVPKIRGILPENFDDLDD